MDYFLPGCPPQDPQIWAVIEAILGGKLPPKGSVVGATEKTVCDECKHVREEKRIKKFYRYHEMIADSTQCLFDQGIICAGPAHVGRLRLPLHQGGYPVPRLLRTAAAHRRSGRRAPLRRRVGGGCGHRGGGGRIVGEIPDRIGTFYRFGLPVSLLHRAQTSVATNYTNLHAVVFILCNSCDVWLGRGVRV